MIIIKELKIKRQYRYVWLKHVEAFDLSEHCAKCLKGQYDKRVGAKEFEYKNLELPPAPYHYFCTVNRYTDNIHLAFEEADGESIIIDNEFYSIEIENARQIKFDNSKIDGILPQASKKEYNTCRNWQFANWIVNS